MDGAFVNVYPDTISNLLGPSQFISSPTDGQGHYRIEVPPGVYYVVARKRLSGQSTGPLSPGDFYSSTSASWSGSKPANWPWSICRWWP